MEISKLILTEQKFLLSQGELLKTLSICLENLTNFDEILFFLKANLLEFFINSDALPVCKKILKILAVKAGKQAGANFNEFSFDDLILVVLEPFLWDRVLEKLSKMTVAPGEVKGALKLAKLLMKKFSFLSFDEIWQKLDVLIENKTTNGDCLGAIADSLIEEDGGGSGRVSLSLSQRQSNLNEQNN